MFVSKSPFSFGLERDALRLATGSEIIEKLPFVEVDEEQVVSSTGALALFPGSDLCKTIS